MKIEKDLFKAERLAIEYAELYALSHKKRTKEEIYSMGFATGYRIAIGEKKSSDQILEVAKHHLSSLLRNTPIVDDNTRYLWWGSKVALSIIEQLEKERE